MSPGRSGSLDAALSGHGTAAHPDSDPVRQQPEQVAGRVGAALAGQSGPGDAAPANATGSREPDQSISSDEIPQSLGTISGTSDRSCAGDPSEGVHQLGGTSPVMGWGVYEPAVRRWEHVLGRPAPAPTLTGKRGGQQLSPVFTEWMMGWPQGWVTGVPALTRNDQLKICGNGVVPQQAVAALEWLLAKE